MVESTVSPGAIVCVKRQSLTSYRCYHREIYGATAAHLEQPNNEWEMVAAASQRSQDLVPQMQ
ncbi:uncharacterized protein LOC142590475 isoform X2 [Dermacentor variabilis]|uniref:uncharacterized protein LOC142590475 isoform X2 n=1 Tax=Dermacentor variabilis TaxID=34621 RepID=UPI003F5C2647